MDTLSQSNLPLDPEAHQDVKKTRDLEEAGAAPQDELYYEDTSSEEVLTGVSKVEAAAAVWFVIGWSPWGCAY